MNYLLPFESFFKAGSGEADRRTLIDFIASDSPIAQEDAEFDALQTRHSCCH